VSDLKVEPPPFGEILSNRDITPIIVVLLSTWRKIQRTVKLFRDCQEPRLRGLAFYIAQSVLVRIRNVKLHRTIGWAGVALGTSMVVVGFWVAVVMARFDTSQLHRANRDAFLIVPLFDIVAFAICFGLAILLRKNPERHRRLMLIATCALTGAAFGRMPLMHAPLYFYGGVDGLILLGALRDLAVSRRIHTVYMIAIPLLVAAQTAVSQVFLHRTAFWMRIAHGLLA
jgi:hypothetical protein